MSWHGYSTGSRTRLSIEAETMRYLDRLQALADAGDVDELEKHGDVYVRRSA